jgi:hypothetical protein
MLTLQQIAQARLAFNQLNITGPESGDRFFEAYGTGNVVGAIDRPYERFQDYETLLILLKSDDPEKYAELHKGTAFFFLGWTAFDLGDFDRAVFYMDAALSEDERKFPVPFEEFMKNPVGQFLRLERTGNQTALRITEDLRYRIEDQLTRFAASSPAPKLDLAAFVENFVMTIARTKEARSIITGIYGFMLECESRLQMLHLRSKAGGSIEPMLTHLFKGGLIFESLLKQLYPNLRQRTLEKITEDKTFQIDFPEFDTRAGSLSGILQGISDNTIQTAFNTTAKLRNTTGHNLIWSDEFDDTENFRKLQEQEVNAIFYIIQKKYL